MKGHHNDFRELKDRTTAPSALKRARGGRTGDPEVRQEADNHERQESKDHHNSHTKNQKIRGTTTKRVELQGEAPRHRGDRSNRKGRAAGGASGAASTPRPPRLGLGGLGGLGNLGGLGGLGYSSQPNLINLGYGIHDSRTPIVSGSKKGGAVARHRQKAKAKNRRAG